MSFKSNVCTMVLAVTVSTLAQSPFPPAGSMAKTIVYGISQSDTKAEADSQIIKFQPDINIRT